MKTKLMMLALVLIGVMASHKAEAFYNPNTGRWLSRDPVREVGFEMARPNFRKRIRNEHEGLYTFVKNNTPNNHDAYGLITFEGCDAGQRASITAAFKDFCSKAQGDLWGCCMDHGDIRHHVRQRCKSDDLHVVCEQKETYFNQCAKRCAYTFAGFGSSTVHLCPGFDDESGCGPIGCTIGHEMVHLVNSFPSSYGETMPQKAEVCAGCPPTKLFPDGIPLQDRTRMSKGCCK
jgi:hypothetical protein